MLPHRWVMVVITAAPTCPGRRHMVSSNLYIQKLNILGLLWKTVISRSIQQNVVVYWNSSGPLGVTRKPYSCLAIFQ